MNVEIILTAQGVTPETTAGKAVAVIDVFRATTVTVEALVNGAEAVIPVAGADEARRLAATFPAGTALLAGERHAVMIEGFDLGNSPRSFLPDVVRGKTVIQTTTNGTLAVSKVMDVIQGTGHSGGGNKNGEEDKCQAGEVPGIGQRFLPCTPPVFIAALLNITAVAESLAGTGRDVVLVCSGREGEFTLEDGLCAGAIAGILSEKFGYGLSDVAIGLSALDHAYRNDPEKILAGSRHYRHLSSIGFGDDIRFSLRRDLYKAVPRLYPDGSVRL